jgi:uncharacterized damage-inducible protein DinB
MVHIILFRNTHFSITQSTAMTKQELIATFCTNHQALINYIDSLSLEKFMLSQYGKWTAGQQLSHIYLCLKPIAQALASKEFIAQKFGTIDREVMEYSEVISSYKSALEKGGVAPARFLPELVTADQKHQLVVDLQELLHVIQIEWAAYSEEELNSLVLPHPLLGSLTISEMFCLMAYHATHHQRQIEQSLEQKGSVKG